KVIKRFQPEVFYTFASYHENDSYYDVHFERAPAEMLAADEQTILEMMMQGLENIIRRRPDEYNWTYNRFRRGADYRRNRYRRKQAMDMIRRIRAGEAHASVFPVSEQVSKR